MNLELSFSLDGVSFLPHGQCELVFVSPTLISLVPVNGNNLIVDAKLRQVPDTGVTLTNAGLTVGTLYYIYAYWTGQAIALEASPVIHAKQPGLGITVKSDDPSRTLVGMEYIAAGGLFSGGFEIPFEGKQFHRSYFNDRGIHCEASLQADRATNSQTWVEMHQELRVEAVLWKDEVPTLNLTGYATMGTTNSFGVSIIDDVLMNDANQPQKNDTANVWISSFVANWYLPISVTSTIPRLPEGYHWFNGSWRVNGGTVTAFGPLTHGTPTSLQLDARRR